MSHSNSCLMVEIFEQCPDPRKHRIQHKLTDIIGIVVFGTICGEDSWDGLIDWTHDKIKFLRRFLSLKSIPSADTLRRVIERLDPKCFFEAFLKWSEELSNRLPGQICIDGKTLRKSGKGKGNLHLVNAWCEQNKIVLGSVGSDSKGKEIPSIKELLDTLSLQRGDIVSIDAIGCQKEIIKKITKKGADYLVALKSNQGNLHDAVENFFKQAEGALDYAPVEVFESNDSAKRRGNQHEVWVSTELDWFDELNMWENLKSIVMVKRKWIDRGKHKEEVRFYISSLSESPEDIGKRVRKHWSIENEYHWHLDVTFGEDDSLIGGKANQNLRVARDIALSLLRKETSKQMGLKRKMRRCARSDDYFQKVLSLGNI